jgi:hypothetical protein
VNGLWTWPIGFFWFALARYCLPDELITTGVSFRQLFFWDRLATHDTPTFRIRPSVLAVFRLSLPGLHREWPLAQILHQPSIGAMTRGLELRRR